MRRATRGNQRFATSAEHGAQRANAESIFHARARGTFLCPSPSANLVGFRRRAPPRPNFVRARERYASRALLSLAQARRTAMNEDSKSHEELASIQSQLTSTPRRRKTIWTWQALCAIFGLAGGIISALLGSLLTIVSWLPIPRNSAAYFHNFGTLLLCLTIPLLIFGGYCFELVETGSRAGNQSGKPSSDIRRKHFSIIIACALLTLSTTFCPTIHAQQTIFNIPSTDISTPTDLE